MVGSTTGVSSYQQTNQVWNSSRSSATKEGTKAAETTNTKTKDEVKVSEWKPFVKQQSSCSNQQSWIRNCYW